ncbi:MAG: ribonuclease [Acidobacteria bacterium]|nr:MAG: ribonuclease [Acidobacteriota bacterium]
MTKELFVSSTPHETKVGMVEDDQLAEVYLERENEYTLAGSIYKGRVTRVLPGMQSAFVDIGLERDAFLYVSDFMELENQDEDLDELPVITAVPEFQSAQPVAAAAVESRSDADSQPVAVSQSPAAPSAPREDRERGGFRGRRRRGGYRDRDSRDSRPSRPAPTEVRSSTREEYGPPAGYEPIVLPGESISKYRDRGPATARPQQSAVATHESPETLADAFPQDEPLFAAGGSERESAGAADFREAEQFSTTWGQPTNYGGTGVSDHSSEAHIETDAGSDEWDRQQKRLHEMNVAAVFGGDTTEGESTTDQELQRTEAAVFSEPIAAQAAAGTVEEEEIDEEEADLASYVEDLEEDAAFDEFEEETHAAGEHMEPGTEIAASADSGANVVPFSAEPVSLETAEVAHAAEEVDDAAEDEAELEEAQAEAEALLAAEAVGDGTVDARAEVRAPAATAAYTQRARRPADRDRGRRGFRRGSNSGGGGRRFRRTEPQNLPLITDLLKEGQEILVQIAKEPIGKKGARITSHIALPGRFLVYMPTVNHTGVSRKIASDEERQRLKRIIQSERENGHGGFIVRTAAQGAAEDELRADIRFLKGLWNEIRTRAENSKPPALIYHDLNVVERILRDQVTSDFSAIWVDTEQEYERILRFANRFQPAIVRRVKLYSKETPLFEQFGLKDEIDKALKSKVWLKSGGYIVINQTEALVAIDVNTGKYVGKTARLEDTIVKTNVDAIKEIVRQIRLRDLGGIIVIDFIDMDERRNRQKVMQALEEALRADRSPSKVLQFNDFGLVAITRKRVKQSLERTIGSPCPYCEATGFVKNVNTVCNEIYIEMRKSARHLEHSDLMLRVHPEVAKALKTNNGRWLNELEELSKKTIIVKSDPALHQEQFDIN